MNYRTRKEFFSAHNLTRLGIFLAILLLLNLTSIGFISIGPINVTTMHIPVVVGAIVGGWQYGLILGLCFGLISCIKALQMMSGPLSFALMNPMISIVPRVLFGVIVGLLANMLKKQHWSIAYGVPAFLGTVLHTVMVMGMMYILYAPQLAEAMNIEQSTVLKFVLGICAGNGIPEAIAATVIAVPLCKVIPSGEKKKVESVQH